MPQKRQMIKDGAKRFEFIRSISGGGMGKIIQARDLHNGNDQVVLKFMKAQYVGQDPKEQEKFAKALERFKREIRIAMELQHPHILPSLGYGYMELDGYEQLYLVFPYVAGGALSNITSQKKNLTWSLEETLDVIVQVAKGLNYMHTHPKHIVHLDVKPNNVLLQPPRYPKSVANVLLCDFGIARWQFTDRDRTSTANVIGTFGYIAPEQAAGKLWWTADQFSLAIMACELLTGKKPVYDLEDRDRIDELMFQQRPSALNRQRVWTSEIDDVILKALKFEPHERFPSVEDFAQALHQAIINQLNNRMGKSSSFAAVYIPHVAAFEESQDLVQPIVIEQQEGEVKSIKRVQKALPLLQTHQVLKKELLPGRPSTICWSPDGEYIACTFYSSILPLIFKRSAGEQSQPIRGTSPGQSACWSPDGHILVMSGPGKIEGQSELCFWNRTVPAEWPFMLSFPVRTIQEFDWSHRGQLAVWIGDQIHIYTIQSNQSVLKKQSLPHFIIAQGLIQGKNNAPNSVMRWSPDGSTLAIGTSNGSLLCWKAESGTLLSQWDTSTSTQRISCLAWNSDSTCLVVAFSNRRIIMWNIYERRILTEWEPSLLPATPRSLKISNQNQIAIVCSNIAQLFFGTVSAKNLSAIHPGQWFATWSPTRTEFATLAPESATTLVVFQS